MINDEGIYIINLMARSYKAYQENLVKLKVIYLIHNFYLIQSTYETIICIENNEDLNRIHFLFKKVLAGLDFEKGYIENIKNFMNSADLSIIQNDFDIVRPKFVTVQNNKTIAQDLKEKK